MRLSSPILVRVPATANPYLAGMPNGTEARRTDQAPRESPLLLPVNLAGAAAVTFTAAGCMTYHVASPPFCDPPSGGFVAGHVGGAEHGISAISAPMDSLLGVFLDDQRPDKSRAPKGLSFGSGRDFDSLAPQLKQVFYIGTGRTRTGVARRFLVPQGATRLFLATMDGFDWNNDTGGFSVAVSVEGDAASSSAFSVDSSITFAQWDCLPNRRFCTPERVIVEPRETGKFHVLLPANLEWGASIPNTEGAPITVGGATGTVCLNPTEGCNGVKGNGKPSGSEFVAPGVNIGALATRTAGGHTDFSVNGRKGGFAVQEGYFEFDVTLHPR
jgi:hypothetical protein